MRFISLYTRWLKNPRHRPLRVNKVPVANIGKGWPIFQNFQRQAQKKICNEVVIKISSNLKHVARYTSL